MVLLSLFALAFILSLLQSSIAYSSAKFSTKSSVLTILFQSASSVNDLDLQTSLDILVRASQTKSEEPDLVVNALLSLEKLMRAKSKNDNGATAKATFEALTGQWRLIFTTGTVDTQKKTGRINYFPLKAVQTFDAKTSVITNSIFLGDFPLIKFSGEFEWVSAPRKVLFDFDKIAVLGLTFNLPKGGAAKIGSASGLGSEGNINLAKQNKKAFFNWISADEDIATARGGGGGLALWRRVPVE